MIINAQYAVGRVVPQEVPKGRVLAHNQIQHTARTPNGVRSFRWWTWPKGEVPPDFKPCKCGWSGLPHVARKPDRRAPPPAAASPGGSAADPLSTRLGRGPKRTADRRRHPLADDRWAKTDD
jgi:hypothetical protein